MYKKMLLDAQAKGLTSEKTMWKSVDSVDALLDKMETAHPDIYWSFMREQHAIVYGGHYSEVFADYDVAQLTYKDKEGKEHHGAHWTKDQVKNATAGKQFPAGTTECDKWVAYNVMYSDLSDVFDDGAILNAAYTFFFSDEDFDYQVKGSKIWHYMQAIH